MTYPNHLNFGGVASIMTCHNNAMCGVVGVKGEGVWGEGEVMLVRLAVGGGGMLSERTGFAGV